MVDVRNVSTNVYAKFRCTSLCIKKALGIFRELITRTTRVAFWDRPSESKNRHCVHIYCVMVIQHQLSTNTMPEKKSSQA